MIDHNKRRIMMSRTQLNLSTCLFWSVRSLKLWLFWFPITFLIVFSLIPLKWSRVHAQAQILIRDRFIEPLSDLSYMFWRSNTHWKCCSLNTSYDKYNVIDFFFPQINFVLKTSKRNCFKKHLAFFSELPIKHSVYRKK